MRFFFRVEFFVSHKENIHIVFDRTCFDCVDEHVDYLSIEIYVRISFVFSFIDLKYNESCFAWTSNKQTWS